MKASYSDITDRLGKPLWWDEHGVPRYEPFSPHMASDIYACEVALLRIACQNCGEQFDVGVSWSDHCGAKCRLMHRVKTGTVHYGDPPNYGCCQAGPTMNCMDLTVLQFWEMSDRVTDEFVRHPELEIELPDWKTYHDEHPNTH